jgi:hypothetical protein
MVIPTAIPATPPKTPPTDPPVLGVILALLELARYKKNNRKTQVFFITRMG